MKITFMLGNGFDIGLGLDTSYESFYQHYCSNTDKDNENIKKFKAYLAKRQDEDVKKIIDWSDFEMAFGQHSNDFDENQKQDFIERFEDFVMRFNEYIEEKEKRVDYSDAGKIGEMMKSAVTTYYHVRPADRAAVQAIYEAYPSSVREYSFITFNYTKTMDECAERLKTYIEKDNARRVGKILHIHGYLEDTMIMGVNDASQISNPVFAKDEDIIREIVKPRQNADARMNYEKNVVSAIDSSDIICVYGMSLGDTDKKWWTYLANWLAKGQRRALVILKYDKDCSKRFPFQVRNKTDEVLKRFLSFAELDDTVKENISKRIYIGINHNVFGMKLYKEKLENKKSDISRVLSAEVSFDPNFGAAGIDIDERMLRALLDSKEGMQASLSALDMDA